MIQETIKTGIDANNFFEINPEYKNSIKIKKIKFALNASQRAMILTIAQEWNFKHYLMIKLQMFTGLRVNELVNLSIPQINLRLGLIRVESRQATKYVKSFSTKTLSSNREVPITAELKNELKAYIGTRRNGYLFQSRKGKNQPILKNTYIGFVNKYARLSPNIGHAIGSHALRRTYASYLLQSGIKLADISKLLGHASIKTTLRYLFEIEPVDVDGVRKALNKMNKRK